jgi:hypothetical protein
MLSRDEMIDLASVWLQDRNAAYLAKENKVVYYSSATGLPGDFQWYMLKPTEVQRMIEACHMSSDLPRVCRPYIVQACQEIGRAYEFGVSSPYPVEPTVFNFENAGRDAHEAILIFIVRDFKDRGYVTLPYLTALEIYEEVRSNLDLDKIPRRQLVNYYHEQCGMHMYEVRRRDTRIMVKGKWVLAITQPIGKPKHMLYLRRPYIDHLVAEVTYTLKEHMNLRAPSDHTKDSVRRLRDGYGKYVRMPSLEDQSKKAPKITKRPKA